MTGGTLAGVVGEREGQSARNSLLLVQVVSVVWLAPWALGSTVRLLTSETLTCACPACPRPGPPAPPPLLPSSTEVSPASSLLDGQGSEEDIYQVKVSWTD